MLQPDHPLFCMNNEEFLSIIYSLNSIGKTNMNHFNVEENKLILCAHPCALGCFSSNLCYLWYTLVNPFQLLIVRDDLL